MSLADASHYMRISSPRTPQVHLIESARGGHLFVADGSRLFDADASLFASYRSAIEGGSEAIEALLRQAGLVERPFIDDMPLAPPPLRALSLAIAQKCNLGCTYCYAQQGEFGGIARNMELTEAHRAVDLLVARAEPGARLNLAFLGGEPLVNRKVLRAATLHALEQAGRRGAKITFSITTNGTLLTEDDGRFFEEHGFAVTVSVDGPREVHDAQRPFKGGSGSFDTVMKRVAPLLKMQQRMQVSARVTVTPHNLSLRRTLDTLVAAGFHSVGFSPMLSAPTAAGEMQSGDLELMLGEMIDCGREYER
ncbi:MAG: radical SAM protein, partial [Bradyrhizobium sp.]|nr:radical SAM protein [Bradyrhizobium sp.]